MLLSQVASRKFGRRKMWRLAPIGIALLLVACAGPLRPSKATEKRTPVRFPIRHLTDVVGTYRNGAGFFGFHAGLKPADMRIFPDGAANWKTIRWMSYADYTDKGVVASPPYPEDTRTVGNLIVRDGLLCSQEGNNEPVFVAYQVDAAALEERNAGYVPSTANRLQDSSAEGKRSGSVLMLIPFGEHQEFESKGASFRDFEFNLFERWSSEPPANSIPIPTPQPELVVAANNDAGVVLEAGDQDGDEIFFTLVDLPAHGRLTLQSKETHHPIYSYRSLPGYLGPDCFSFKASDGRGTSVPCEIKIQVMEQPRVIVPEGLTTAEGVPLAISLVAVPLGNLPGRKAILEIPWYSTRHSGRVQRSSVEHTFTYQPRKGFVGTDTFSCRAIDDRWKSEDVTVTIVVTTARTSDVSETKSPK